MIETAIQISMGNASTQDTLFPMPEVAKSTMATVEERAKMLSVISESVGGLLPRSIASDLLDTSPTRIAQLIETSDLEEVKYFGVSFISGRSIREWQKADRDRGGRGKRRKIGIWKQIVIGLKLGKDFGEVYTVE